MGPMTHMLEATVAVRPCDGFRPYTPLKAVGIRTLPPVCPFPRGKTGEGEVSCVCVCERVAGAQLLCYVPASVPMAMGTRPAPSEDPAPEDEPPG